MIDGVRTVEFMDRTLSFVIANEAARWRVDTFHTKEPETLKWISGFGRDDLFVDVGANVGVYTIAAAKGAGCRVLAFEPEAENFALLNRNIRENALSERVDAFPVALADKSGLGRLIVTPEPAHSGHQLFQGVIGAGNVRSQGCVYATLADCLFGLVADYIKIDVDGLEPLVVEGIGLRLLYAAKSILIEIDPHKDSHKQMLRTMSKLGFKCDPRQVEASRRKSGPFTGFAEMIFYRD